MKLIKRIFCAMAWMIVSSVAFTSCEGLSESLSGSDDETVKALKEALNIGVRVAVDKLSNDGYIAEAATKIGVPEGAQTALAAFATIASTKEGQAILTAAGCNMKDGMEETMVELFNGAATEAAQQAADIFVSAISNFTIEDGMKILKGGDGAATVALKNSTYTPLQAAFHPTITKCMNSFKVGGYTATTIWSEFASLNNTLASYANSSTGKTAIKFAASTNAISSSQVSAINSIQPVETDISDYLTGKALDGLFLKVEEKENGIRRNAAERTSDLLRRVFGQLD